MQEEYRYPDSFLLVGKVIKPQALKGEVRVRPFTDTPESLLCYNSFSLVTPEGRLSPSLQVGKSRIQGRDVVIKFDRITSRDDAEKICSSGLLLKKCDLSTLEADEYYWYQFLGLEVTTDSGEFLGKVARIFSNGAQDILVIRDRDAEYLVPITAAIIKEHTDRALILTPPPGLLEINQKSGTGRSNDTATVSGDGAPE